MTRYARQRTIIDLAEATGALFGLYAYYVTVCALVILSFQPFGFPFPLTFGTAFGAGFLVLVIDRMRRTLVD